MSEEPKTVQEDENEAEDVLSDEILTDAKKRGERTVKRAERDGKKVVDRAVKEAEAMRKRVLERADEQVAREQKVFESSIALEERMRRLKAQGELLEEAFGSALAKLRAREGFNYDDVFVKLAVEAIDALEGDAFVLRLSPSDVDAMKGDVARAVSAAAKKDLDRDVTLTVETARAPISGGVIVETPDGSRRVNNSFAGRLERMKDDLRFGVADVLFGKEEDRPEKEES
jgi:V/A-type H+-transporting ATPase subunit E